MSRGTIYRVFVLAFCLSLAAAGAVLIRLPSPPTASAVPSGMRLLTGTYVGDGVDDRQISGLGFQPDLVLVRSDGADPVVMRTSTVAGDASKVLSEVTALQPDLVQSLDGDGFTIGADARVNGSGITYYWVAMQAGPDLAVGSYVGDGVDNRSISGVGFQPVWVLTFADSKDSYFRPSDVVGDASYKIAGYTTVVNRIQALEADGFQIGSHGDANESGQTYHYVAWGASPQVSAGSYTGDGTDNRSITGVGLAPAFVWVKGAAGSQATWRPASVGGDRSLNFDAASPGGNRIQALEADGFQVGTAAQVNTAGATYFYLALGDDVGQSPTPTPTATAAPTDTPTATPTPKPGGAPVVPVFDDVSAAAGLKTTDQKSFGMQWADYDNDGWPDFYIGRHGGAGVNLYRNRGNGTFQDVSTTSGVRDSGDRHGCVWGDITEDGLIDLFCSVAGMDAVLINQGDGTFVDQGRALGFGKGSGRTANVLDFDKDGLLDVLYGDTQYVRLWRNLGNKFTSVGTFGTTGNEGPRSGSTADYDGDGITDAFIGKYPHTDWLLLRGTGSGFVDATAAAGLNLTGAQAGTWGDYDNDGDLDLFVTYWKFFCCSEPPKLLENQGNGTFVEVTSAARINQGSPARVGLWGDFNNDGWLDLFVVNGARNDDGYNRPDQLYLNTGNKRFIEAGALAGIQGPSQGSGDSAAWADYDHDGDLDILVGNGSGELGCKPSRVPNCLGPDKLYQNTGTSGYSFQLRLVADADAFGYGTKVWVTTSQGTQYREMNDGMVGKSQLPQVLHFGLGTSDKVDVLRIRWPDGVEETYSNVAANTSPLVVQQGVGIVP